MVLSHFSLTIPFMALWTLAGCESTGGGSATPMSHRVQVRWVDDNGRQVLDLPAHVTVGDEIILDGGRIAEVQSITTGQVVLTVDGRSEVHPTSR